MTNEDKKILTTLCRRCKSYVELLEECKEYDINCSEQTIKKYWRILGSEH